MPGLGEVLALPAPPEGGLGVLPESQVQDEDMVDGDKENGTVSLKPAPTVATQTKTIGMIHPPPDIRSIVDKTAQFVARNGPEFEKRILANEKNNVKFNFLTSTDPYHAYYQHRVSEFKIQLAAPAGGAPAAALANAEDGAPPSLQEQADAVAVEAPAKPPGKMMEPPEPEMYTVRLPEQHSAIDLDIIKLTAQFVARNGKTFLTGLTNREHSNAQFHFLKPTHSMFTFFTALADAYSKVLMPPKGLVEKLKKDVDNKTGILERCLHRLEWERSQERARQKAEDEIEQERLQMALIDWHDFVVVETIEFAEEEDEELPQPMTVEEVIRRSKASAADEDVQEATETDKDMEMDMDEEELQMVEEGMKTTTISDSNGTKATEAAQAPPVSEDEEEAPMRIVTGWKRPEERLAAEKDAVKFVVSPITNELIPINEMAEHMRISLIDPKYKEQKERMMAKLRETTLATDDEISRNIVGLARTRPDIFGTTEEEVSNAVKAEIEVKKDEPKQVIWDGHTGSISRTATQAMAQTMTLDEQIAAIHREKANLAADGRPLPGPAAPPVPKLAATPARPPLPPVGLAPNIPRPAHLPGQAPTIQVTPPLAPTPARPAILPTPPPLRQAPIPPSLPTPPVLISRPPPPAPPTVTHPPPMGPPPGMGQYMPPPPRPYLPMPVAPPPPPQLSAMPPPPPPEEAPPPPPEEPEPKRQKVDEVLLIPEDQFLVQHPVWPSPPPHWLLFEI